MIVQRGCYVIWLVGTQGVGVDVTALSKILDTQRKFEYAFDNCWLLFGPPSLASSMLILAFSCLRIGILDRRLLYICITPNALVIELELLHYLGCSTPTWSTTGKGLRDILRRLFRGMRANRGSQAEQK